MDPDGVLGVRSNPFPAPQCFLSYENEIIWSHYLVSVRPNYFIFMGYLRKMRSNYVASLDISFLIHSPCDISRFLKVCVWF